MDIADAPLRELMKMWDAGSCEDASETNGEILSLIRQLGGNAAKYKRERGKAMRAIISNMYSPPSVSSSEVVSQLRHPPRDCTRPDDAR